MSLPMLAADKANHALYGALVFCAVAGAAAASGQAAHARAAGLAAAVLVALGKEAADWIANRRAARAGLPAPHGVEWRDAIATIAGALLVAAASLLP